MSHVVPDVVQKVLKGQDPLHILGDGTQVRHYTYGGDLARGIVDRDRAPRRAQRRLQPLDQPVDDRARARRGDLEEDPGRAACPSVTCPTTRSSTTSQKRVPYTEKAKRVLGFEATTSLSDMLDEVIPWVEAAVADGRIWSSKRAALWAFVLVAAAALVYYLALARDAMVLCRRVGVPLGTRRQRVRPPPLALRALGRRTDRRVPRAVAGRGPAQLPALRRSGDQPASRRRGAAAGRHAAGRSAPVDRHDRRFRVRAVRSRGPRRAVGVPDHVHGRTGARPRAPLARRPRRPRRPPGRARPARGSARAHVLGRRGHDGDRRRGGRAVTAGMARRGPARRAARGGVRRLVAAVLAREELVRGVGAPDLRLDHHGRVGCLRRARLGAGRGVGPRRGARRRWCARAARGGSARHVRVAWSCPPRCSPARSPSC